MIVDHSRKVAYCEIEKTGVTTWKMVMANNTLNGKRIPAGTDPKKWIHTRLRQFGLSVEKYSPSRHRTYTKFMVTRHPFDRLISAYYDKAFPNFIRNGNAIVTQLSKPISNWVISQFHNTDKSINKSDYNATFWEFVKYALHRSDKHWSPYHSKCGECFVDYDFILRTETLNVDAKLFLEKSYPHLTEIPAYNAMRKTKSAKQNVKTLKFLKEFNQLNDQEVMTLLQKYKLDLEPLGYNYNIESQIASCSFRDDSGKTCC